MTVAAVKVISVCPLGKKLSSIGAGSQLTWLKGMVTVTVIGSP